MKISVIIPYCNRKESLKYVLWNLYNEQKRPADEVIVVSDEDVSDIEDLKEKYPFVHLKIDSPKDGVFRAGKARNIGAAASTGEILIFQDQDMILNDRYLKVAEKYYESRSQIICGIFNDIDKEWLKVPEEDMFDYIKIKNKWVNVDMDSVAHRIAEIVEWLPHVTESRAFGIKKQTFFDIGSFDEMFTGWGLEDTEFFWRAHKKGYKVHKLLKLYAVHIEHQVDPVYMIESMKENAQLFVNKHPEARLKLQQMWKNWSAFGDNPVLERTLALVKKVRKKSGVADFGVLPTMRMFGFWRY